MNGDRKKKKRNKRQVKTGGDDFGGSQHAHTTVAVGVERR